MRIQNLFALAGQPLSFTTSRASSSRNCLGFGIDFHRSLPSRSIAASLSPARLNAVPKMTVSNDPSEDVIRVGDYPFYRTQPTAQMRRVVEHNRMLLREKVGGGFGDEILATFPMGSGAIEGMPGPAQVDLLVVLRGKDDGAPVVTEAQIAALKAGANLHYNGPSPHHPEGDVWFRNEVFEEAGNPNSSGGVSSHWEDDVERAFEPGGLGSLNVHMVRIGTAQEGPAKERDDRTREFVLDAVAFVDYLTQNREGFREYADVKVEGAEMVLAVENDGNEKDTGEDPFNTLIKYKRHKGKVAKKLVKEAREWRLSGQWKLPEMEEEARRMLVPEDN
ncbi:hypothetical protein ACHAWF_001978 [Thalassiosira exigua]